MNDKQYRKLSDRCKQDYNHPEYALKLDYQILFNLSDRDINQLHIYFNPHRIVNGLNKEEIREFILKQDLADKGFNPTKKLV
jgi:hypothetical protein